MAEPLEDIIEEAFFLIPDISGFTHFIGHTEIKHSVHIIAELLENIIENNTLGLKIAEIEGDAIFFYRLGGKPTLEELQDQVQKMYNAFYTITRTYERDRVCDCGACTTTHKLQLKFVAHHGNVVRRVVSGFTQLMGVDVTVVHRLLKNSIQSSSYLLYTQDSVIHNGSLQSWPEFNIGKENYDVIGDVNVEYTELNHLFEQLPELPPQTQFAHSEDTQSFGVDINANADQVYANLINLRLRTQWIGAPRIKFKEDRVYRIGSTHECILPFGNAQFETVLDQKEQNKIVYAEFVSENALSPPFYELFEITRKGENNCRLDLTIHLHGSPFKNKMAKFFQKKAIEKSLIKFKALCES